MTFSTLIGLICCIASIGDELGSYNNATVPGQEKQRMKDRFLFTATADGIYAVLYLALLFRECRCYMCGGAGPPNTEPECLSAKRLLEHHIVVVNYGREAHGAETPGREPHDHGIGTTPSSQNLNKNNPSSAPARWVSALDKNWSKEETGTEIAVGEHAPGNLSAAPLPGSPLGLESKPSPTLSQASSHQGTPKEPPWPRRSTDQARADHQSEEPKPSSILSQHGNNDPKGYLSSVWSHGPSSHSRSDATHEGGWLGSDVENVRDTGQVESAAFSNSRTIIDDYRPAPGQSITDYSRSGDHSQTINFSRIMDYSRTVDYGGAGDYGPSGAYGRTMDYGWTVNCGRTRNHGRMGADFAAFDIRACSREKNR